MRDVTKTKPSHHRSPQGPAKAPAIGAAVPSTGEGVRLAAEVQGATTLSVDAKSRLTREIVDYEALHGECTKTFSRKIRRQLRPAP
jgi:hypothetical protein